MHKLPLDLNLNGLIEQDLSSVRVGKFDAQFCFQEGLTIQAFHKVILSSNQVEIAVFNQNWLTTEPLKNIIGEQVISFSKETELLFQITLTNEKEISFVTEVSQYESINIEYPNGKLIVI